MIKTFFINIFVAIILLTSLSSGAPDPNFHIYLLFGQSNMAGGGNTTDLIPQDCDTSPRVKVLAFCDCSGSSPDCKQLPLNRTHDKWYTASPPLHICSEGISPGDWFAKTMLDSVRDDITIGMVPCALSGQSIKVFSKGGSNFNLPTWAHPTLGNSSPYDWMVKRCKIAQESGVIKGILFHQGENDVGQSWWTNTTKEIFDNLKKDLSLESKMPVVVGELVQDQGACCASHNTLVDKLASEYPNCGLASSKGLTKKSGDQYNAHFNAAGMREMGKRYAQAFLTLADKSYVPRKGSVAVRNPKEWTIASLNTDNSFLNDVTVYTLNGKLVTIPRSIGTLNNLRKINHSNVYLLVCRRSGMRSQLMVIP
jgi:hypothetical protein